MSNPTLVMMLVTVVGWFFYISISNNLGIIESSSSPGTTLQAVVVDSKSAPPPNISVDNSSSVPASSYTRLRAETTRGDMASPIIPPPDEEEPDDGGLFRRLVLPQPPTRPWRWRPTRVVVDTIDWKTGGPEALLQLHLALKHAGYDTRVTHDVAPDFKPLYPEAYDLSIIDLEQINHDDPQLQAGDAIILPEGFEYNHFLGHFPAGLRVARWMLQDGDKQPSDVTQLHHSYDLASLLNSPMSSVIMPYINRARMGPTDLTTVIKAKENVICVDNDAESLFEPDKMVSHLQAEGISASVIVFKGLSYDQLEAAYRRCKIVFDSGMPGMERVPLEGASWGALVMLWGDQVSNNYLDFPIPNEYQGGFTYEGMVEVVRHGLNNYEKEVLRFEPLRQRIRLMEPQFESSVKRLMDQSAMFLIPCERPGAGYTTTDCLLTAISILIVSPMSNIRIFTGTTTTAFNNDVNNIGMTEALQDLHMTHMIYPGGYTRLQDLPALAQVAPNHRLVLVSPTTVMVNGDFLDHYKDIPLEECLLHVPSTSQAEAIKLLQQQPSNSTEDDLLCLLHDHSNNNSSSSSFTNEFTKVKAGLALQDRDNMNKFVRLCSSRAWEIALSKSSSLEWQRFCRAVKDSNRRTLES